jgi:hypothetical protein
LDGDGNVDKEEFMNLLKTKNVHLNDKQQSDIMEYLKVIFSHQNLLLKRDRFLKTKNDKKYQTNTKVWIFKEGISL